MRRRHGTEPHGTLCMPNLGGKALDQRFTGHGLKPVVQILQGDEILVFVLKRLSDQVIGERRVLGQQAAMGVGAEGVLVACAFEAVLTVIAKALHNFAQRLDLGA